MADEPLPNGATRRAEFRVARLQKRFAAASTVQERAAVAKGIGDLLVDLAQDDPHGAPLAMQGVLDALERNLEK